METDQFFRAGVGAVIIGRDGRVLTLERADVPGAWQLPQGGLQHGETPRDAVLREIREETGLLPSALEPLGQYPEPLAYELPPDGRSDKTGRGQTQYWFYFRLTAPDSEIRPPEGGEFSAWRWERFDELLDGVVAFRRPIYRKLAGYLGEVGL